MHINFIQKSWFAKQWDTDDSIGCDPVMMLFIKNAAGIY